MKVDAEFPGFIREFPLEECNLKNPKDPWVLDSSAVYLCILLDARCPSALRVVQAKPYTYNDPEDGLLYGWVDALGQNVYDNLDHAIHNDSERVVAWKRIDDFSDFDDVTW